MKKILLFALVTVSVGVVHAQSSADEARRVILGGGGSARTGQTQTPRDGNAGNESARRAEIDQINREYDARIAGIRNSPAASAAEKERAIRGLNEERAQRIREVNARYGTSNANQRYKKAKTKHKIKERDDDDDRFEERENRGRRLGWEKGKGNPHRNGGKPKGKGRD
jgi:hypothetical protein